MKKGKVEREKRRRRKKGRQTTNNMADLLKGSHKMCGAAAVPLRCVTGNLGLESVASEPTQDRAGAPVPWQGSLAPTPHSTRHQFGAARRTRASEVQYAHLVFTLETGAQETGQSVVSSSSLIHTHFSFLLCSHHRPRPSPCRRRRAIAPPASAHNVGSSRSHLPPLQKHNQQSLDLFYVHDKDQKSHFAGKGSPTYTPLEDTRTRIALSAGGATSDASRATNTHTSLSPSSPFTLSWLPCRRSHSS